MQIPVFHFAVCVLHENSVCQNAEDSVHMVLILSIVLFRVQGSFNFDVIQN